MTIEELKMSSRPVVGPEDVAPLVHLDACSIRKAARNKDVRDLLGFPVIVCGNQVRIPRRAFLKAMGEQDEKSKPVCSRTDRLAGKEIDHNPHRNV